MGKEQDQACFVFEFVRIFFLIVIKLDLLLLIFQVLYWLSGLTCTDENFIAKSGAQRAASAEGVALIAPDTSPSKSSTINSTRTFSEQFRDSQLFCNTTLFHIT